jgi:non-ribosomal peptide synthetase component F
LSGGDGLAVVCGEERVTHAALSAWSSRLGWKLHGLGVSADHCVGLCVERSAGLVAGLLGIWRAGGAFVPLDPQSPSERLHAVARDADLHIVTTRRRNYTATKTVRGELKIGAESK